MDEKEIWRMYACAALMGTLVNSMGAADEYYAAYAAGIADEMMKQDIKRRKSYKKPAPTPIPSAGK